MYEKQYSDFKRWLKQSGRPLDANTARLWVAWLRYSRKPRLEFSSIWSYLSQVKAGCAAEFGTSKELWNLAENWLSTNEKQSRREPKQSKVLTRDDINRYLASAPDSDLHWKTLLCVAVFGGLRTGGDADRITWNMVTLYEDHILFNLNFKTKNNKPFSFHILKQGESSAICPYSIISTYMRLKPVETPGTAKFWQYCTKNSEGKVVMKKNAPIGKNMLRGAPKKIANFLKLQSPQKFTGHCFRRTAATLAANNGATNIQLQKAFRWSSPSMANRYVENSNLSRNLSARLIQGVPLLQGQPQSTQQPANITFNNCNRLVLDLGHLNGISVGTVESINGKDGKRCHDGLSFGDSTRMETRLKMEPCNKKPKVNGV